jgi:hypothetical protein
MVELTGDIWRCHEAGMTICITTNGVTKADGTAVMGAGIAKQAALKFPSLPRALGRKLRCLGNRVYFFPEQNIITFPTKYDWRDNSDLTLIARSCMELMGYLDSGTITYVALPRPGCSNGKLNWLDVKKVIEPLLDHRVSIVCL